jgi:hypothetical protein
MVLQQTKFLNSVDMIWTLLTKLLKVLHRQFNNEEKLNQMINKM